jgi:hypothetical protein
VVAVLAALGIWLVLSPGNERPERAEPADEHEEDEAEHVALADPVEAPPRKAELPKPDPAPAPSVSSDGVVGPHPDDPHLPGMKPHPVTPEHERIYAENALIQSLNDAMSFRKVKEMREMLVEYRKLDPTDVDANQAGYEVIADCIEFPGDASLTAARQFYDTQRHSALRRFVRRICFENSN